MMKYINLESLNVGSTQPLITGKDLKNISFQLPQEPLIDYFHSFFTTIRERQNLLSDDSKVLMNLRKTLLPKLISGRLRIKDAEKFIEKVGI